MGTLSCIVWKMQHYKCLVWGVDVVITHMIKVFYDNFILLDSHLTTSKVKLSLTGFIGGHSTRRIHAVISAAHTSS